MSLFNKEKEIIWKITNAILLIWLIGAIVFTFTSIINLVLKEPQREYTYEEYKATNCVYKDSALLDEENEQICKTQYNDYNFSNEHSDYYEWKNLYYSIANVIVVGSFIFLINRKK